MDAERIEAVVRAYLRDEAGMDEAELSRDAMLVRTGRLDSADLVQLATHLERTFGIEIPDPDIDADHLDSIGQIAAYVASRLPPG
jgi:acyl carrier protein